jgi:hypothetical protein
MKLKTLAATVIATATSIAMMMGIITSASEHNVSTQMMTIGDRGGGFGNMTSGQQESYPFFNVIGTK